MNIHPMEQYVIDSILKIRREKGLSQADIAKIINTTPSFVGNVENARSPAKYNLKHIYLIAMYLNISPQVFLPAAINSNA
jgi:transcriptional regulator with XRE-family HTH domain